MIGKGLKKPAKSGAKFGEFVDKDFILSFGGAGVCKVWLEQNTRVEACPLTKEEPTTCNQDPVGGWLRIFFWVKVEMVWEGLN